MIKYGPYVVVKNILKTREFKEKDTRRRCSKCGETWPYYKFCPNCGAKIYSKSVEKIKRRKAILGEDFLKTQTLWFLDTNRSILVPHKKWMKSISFEKKDREFAIELKRLDADDILDETGLFEKAFSKELKELRENYESVEIKFGIVNFYD